MTFYSIWKINYCIFNTKKILKIGLENKKFCTNYCIGFFDIYVEWNLQQTLGYATSEISAAIVTHCKRTSFKGMHPYNSILPSWFYSGRVIILGFEPYVLLILHIISYRRLEETDTFAASILTYLTSRIHIRYFSSLPQTIPLFQPDNPSRHRPLLPKSPSPTSRTHTVTFFNTID